MGLQKLPVLDHGYVILRNMAGPVRRGDQEFDASDLDPAISARMSFDNFDEARTPAEDIRLTRYLMRHQHNTPIQMVDVWVEMKMPIFVARQFVRHRTANINEVSGRYVELPEEWYIPKPEHVGIKPPNVKQGRVMVPVDQLSDLQRQRIATFLRLLNHSCELDYHSYLAAINDGIPHELARCFLHVNHYTRWLWKQDLHNLMHFLALRLDNHAQWEAQQFARAVLDALRPHLPDVCLLFDEFRRHVVS